ncbi:MAG: GGDEF domain-containing protein, partial [Candidatus Woesearchaeota archaeon]|nr:GGDEF domain-containing protein [Candidatus Woesearchaeota archaeon]
MFKSQDSTKKQEATIMNLQTVTQPPNSDITILLTSSGIPPEEGREIAEIYHFDPEGAIQRILSFTKQLETKVERQERILGAKQRRINGLEIKANELELKVSTLQPLVERDQLTGIYNRRSFDTDLPSLLERAYQERKGVALLSVDLRNFKLANDTAGHAGGDLVLQAVSEILSKSIR